MPPWINKAPAKLHPPPTCGKCNLVCISVFRLDGHGRGSATDLRRRQFLRTFLLFLSHRFGGPSPNENAKAARLGDSSLAFWRESLRAARSPGKPRARRPL